MKKTNQRIKQRCGICGRKLTRADLTISRGNLIPLYNYVTKNGEVKPICVTCYHKLSAIRLINRARRELATIKRTTIH